MSDVIQWWRNSWPQCDLHADAIVRSQNNLPDRCDLFHRLQRTKFQLPQQSGKDDFFFHYSEFLSFGEEKKERKSWQKPPLRHDHASLNQMIMLTPASNHQLLRKTICAKRQGKENGYDETKKTNQRMGRAHVRDTCHLVDITEGTLWQ